MAYFTIILARVGRQQTKDTRILQRAYLATYPFGIQMGTDALGSVEIKNNGNMPARHVRYFTALEFSTHRHFAPAQAAISDDKFYGDNTLVPGVSMKQSARASVTIDEITRIKFEKMYAYFWGIIRYQDGFGVARTTYFCHRYNARAYVWGDSGHELIAAEARLHESGNDAD